jgi:hypothetical protein
VMFGGVIGTDSMIRTVEGGLWGSDDFMMVVMIKVP